ncbi:hypothetical protein [Nocardioides alcanivorans]|uniref:hypothetical protein n=1 Tax=Nocardioides alcanivorans TaxID=2897352 RepID=UPI001F36F9E9|nr:hypothetical protein [Nocardioides alcanivorans]
MDRALQPWCGRTRPREWRAAATWFEQASGVAPESAHCRIALNWTWTLEAAGDDFADAGDEQTATLRWAEARRVLTEADGCDEGAASEQPPSPEPESPEPNDEGEDSDPADSERGRVDQTRERLEKKLEVGEQEPQQGPEEEAQEEQADRLTDRNREAARERRRNQDQREGRPDDGPDRTW